MGHISNSEDIIISDADIDAVIAKKSNVTREEIKAILLEQAKETIFSIHRFSITSEEITINKAVDDYFARKESQ